MIVASDQGAVVTVDGGTTWSSWYNQPTAQFYHVATDDRFPYWIYGAQQASGAAATPVRTDYRSITQRDWNEISAGGESDYILPDPTDPDIVWGGRVGRFDWRTLRSADPPAHPGDYRPGVDAPARVSCNPKRSISDGSSSSRRSTAAATGRRRARTTRESRRSGEPRPRNRGTPT
jgi:hypothetical protein